MTQNQKEAARAALTKAISLAGGTSALASKLEITRQAIPQWRGIVPTAARARQIEAVLGGLVTREELRPDYFG